MEEIWKDIPGYEGKYQISNLGNVKSFNYYRKKISVILKKSIRGKNKASYLCVGLKGKIFNIHRLIAISFIENPENKPYINHINGIKTDNRMENLEWCTAKENISHSFKIGLQKIKKGEKNHNSKKINQYDLEGNLIKTWGCMMDIQRELGINCGNVYCVCSGKRKTAGGYKWKYFITLTK